MAKQGRRRRFEEPDLSDEEDEILDEVWGRIGPELAAEFATERREAARRDLDVDTKGVDGEEED